MRPWMHTPAARGLNEPAARGFARLVQRLLRAGATRDEMNREMTALVPPREGIASFEVDRALLGLDPPATPS